MAFKQVRLGDYFKFEKGLGYKGEFLAEESDVALIGMDSHEEGGGYKENSEKFYTGPYKPENVAEVGDVIFAGTEQGFGLLASPLMVPESDKFSTYLFSGDVLKAIPLKPDEFSVEYLYNMYRVDLYRTKAAYGDSGTTVRRISNENLGEQVVPLPDLPTQIAINEIISLIDQQIANNKALSRNLEALAQSLFKSWFIDFDPVLAKSKGDKPFGMDAETASLFPSSFEKVDEEEIPVGWKVGSIKDICVQIVNGSTPYRRKSVYWENGTHFWFKTRELSDGYLIESAERITDLATKETSVKVLPAGSVLMAIYAAPTVGRLGVLTTPSTFNQACTGMVPLEKFGTEFLYQTLFNKRDWFNEMASGAAQQNISKAIVEECPITIPPDEVIAAYRTQIEVMFSSIRKTVIDNQDLNALLSSLIFDLCNGTYPELLESIAS